MELFYAKINLDGDIPAYKFETKEELINFIDHSIIFPLKMENEKVFLLAINDEVFVTENGQLMRELIEKDLYYLEVFEAIHIQEYSSFEEAYEVALLMKEVSLLAYKKDHTENGGNIQILWN